MIGETLDAFQDMVSNLLLGIEWVFLLDWSYLASQAFGFDLVEAFAVLWFVIKFLMLTIALVIFVSGAEDLFIDLYYWWLKLKRLGDKDPHELPRKLKSLKAVPQLKLAIIVPAWDESDVIARMISNTINTVDYDNFHIFAGTYPNDPDSAREVDRMAARYSNVHRAEVGHPGPTSKADCLNWIVQRIFLYEEETGEKFDGFVMQDSEDVVNPLSLRVINWVLPSRDFMQLPVFSMNRDPLDMVACHYMDEFAEWHNKDLLVREAMTGIVPSAGVASAFSRNALIALSAATDDQPFNTDSLTEDYDIAMRLHDLDMPGAFVRYWAEVPHERASWITGRKVMRTKREIVSTKEFFPDQMWASIRQKARWTLGISFLGWEQLGWQGRWQDLYFLYRDRKGMITAPAAIIGYAIVLQIAAYYLALNYIPDLWQMPPLIEPGSWVWYIIAANLFFLLNRLFHRAWFVGRTHGLIYVPLSPLRAVVANWIGFRASLRALKQYLWYRMSGQRLTWDKTTHAYPSLAELKQGKPKIGEVLTYWGAIAVADVETALAKQQVSYRPFGLSLLDQALVDEDSLANAFAEQAGVAFEGFDALKVQAEALAELSPRDAARFAVVPVSLSNGELKLAAAEPLAKEQMEALRAVLTPGRRISIVIAPRSDVAFGLRYAWDHTPIDREIKDAVLLRRLQMVDQDGIERLWRHMRRRHVLLGDVLVRLGLVSHDALTNALTLRGDNVQLIGDALVSSGAISKAQLRDALDLQPQPPLDILSVAVELALIPASQVKQVQKELEGAR